MPLDYDSIAEGDSLPTVQRRTSKLRILQFVGAGWMWDPAFFWDPESAADTGLAGPILPGPYKHALVQQYLMHWLGRISSLRRVQVSHRRPDLHSSELTFGGTITRKYEEDGHRLADVEVFIDQESGERSVRGSATVEF
jgi:hypothetical protein